jgi:integrase/recombinase XerD
MDVYVWVLSTMDGYLSKDVDQISPTDLRQFMLYLRTEYTTRAGKPLSPSSIQNAWKALRSFFEWCNLELGVDNPAADLPLPRVPPTEIQPLTRSEISELLSKASLRDKAIILVLLDTGVRAGELCRILQEHVNLSTGAALITPHGRKTRSRTVHTSRPTIKAILRYLLTRNDSRPHLFLNKYHQPLNRNSVRLALRRLGEQVNVKVHPHKFRHTFAIEYLRNGGDPWTLQATLGHSTMEMVKTYLRIVQVDLENAHRQASPVVNWKL